jgi:hypothetical protein
VAIPLIKPCRLDFRVAVIGWLTGALAFLPCAASSPACAQEQGYGQTLGTTPEERQIYGDGPNSTGGEANDAMKSFYLQKQFSNEKALQERLNKATPPKSAVDKALEEFNKSNPQTTPVRQGRNLNSAPK